MKKSILTLAMLSALSLAACSNNGTEQEVPVNAVPTVNAGEDQTVDVGQEVILAATINDDDEVIITWSQTAGSTVSLGQNGQSTIAFTAPQLTSQEILTFELTVNDGTNSPVTDSIDITINPIASSQVAGWIINNTSTSNFISSTTGSVLENVQVAELVDVNENNTEVKYIYVESSGIPKYDVTISQDVVDQLNQRPKASTDFRAGSTTVVDGQTVSFGEDVGYDSSTENCLSTGGDGYWPPGPGCPTQQDKKVYFPKEPTAINETEEDCETGLGKIGLMVNGTSIYNWGDGMSEGNNLWYNLAPVAEQYDVDICGGHAAQGDYHHHFYTSCLANLVNDDNSGHSPIYGYSADGYPLYGPYENENTLAISGWKIRDYGADESQGGCSTEGERSCVLIDQYDFSKGVEQVTNGPNINANVTTLSGNILPAVDGYFFEDHYYAGDLVAGAQLDKHNGHDTNDDKGYHYHITLTQAQDGKLTPAFPYTIGPNFKGKLATNSISQCGAAGGGGGMPPPPPRP